ncbi:MAG: TolC family protein [Acidobacteriota bacterium]|nr:TolC family protein [Acidobacteriota bacterium]
MSKVCQWFALVSCSFSLSVAAQIPVAPEPQAPVSTQPAFASPTAAPDGQPLTRVQAEQLALKNNPRISVQALLALAQKQVAREARAGELPSLYGNATAVGAEEASRLSSGSLSSSRLLNHVGAGVQLNQLITDFGHTRNLVASSSFQAQAAEQNAEATREDILLATDLAFYSALEAQATLRVAQSTVAERQSVGNQVNALTASKLKSTLDLSFANVNLSQARLLALDSENQVASAMASLNEILGTATDHPYVLVDDASVPPPPPSSADAVIALALQQRPDLKALQLRHEADIRFSRAQHEQLLPTISAEGVVGGTPVRSSTYFLQDWYGAAGVNVNIPIFNGFKFHAEAAEADDRAKASDQESRQLVDTIVRDVRTAWLTASTAQQRMSVTADLVKEANTALNLAQTRYQLGLSSIVELSQAQLQQTQAQIADANARFQYEADLATLRFQSGARP